MPAGTCGGSCAGFIEASGYRVTIAEVFSFVDEKRKLADACLSRFSGFRSNAGFKERNRRHGKFDILRPPANSGDDGGFRVCKETVTG